MAKDPAINWYFDNWDGGTKLMSRHQKGCYIDLLSAQFHCGHLTIENIRQILGSDFAEWEKCLKAKFEMDENGMFFNGRIEHEIQKRLNEKMGKSTGGKNAMKKRWGDKYLNKIPNKNLNKTLNKTLGTEIETENENTKEGGVGETIVFPVEHSAFVALQDTRWAEKAKATEERIRTFNDYLISIGEHEKNPADYKKHFTNWWKKQKNETNFRVIKSKSTGAEQLLESLRADIEATGT